MRMTALTLAGIIGLMGIGGCEPTDEQQQPGEPTNGTQQDPGTTPPPEDTTAPPPGEGTSEQPTDTQQQPLGIERSDEELAREVRDQIQQDVDLDPQGRNITVSVQDGQVTLSGQVQSEQESQRIEQIAADAAGEENVENELEVQEGQQPQEDPQELQEDPQQQDPQQP